ncbi:nuclear transport factor 2 family protein [Tomitella gaofuii]|uniref:nuclear transport factor 2 family protein n=1 Tax=Tomitella gaofuii TaxID=2760083 RepID=UPI0015F8C347|nr:nuclear transport factor 2 family protein [Tomitella gaofuii]
MGTFTEAELTDAFTAFLAEVDDLHKAGKWERFADLFTDDVVYIEHAFGRFTTREQVRDWSVKTMTSFPGNHMTEFPPLWYLVDAERGRIVAEVDNPMRDPGDGSVHTATNISIYTYAGDGKWSGEEDVYNPMEFAQMAMGWCERAQELGTLTDEARTWMEKMRKVLPR